MCRASAKPQFPHGIGELLPLRRRRRIDAGNLDIAHAEQRLQVEMRDEAGADETDAQRLAGSEAHGFVLSVLDGSGGAVLSRTTSSTLASNQRDASCLPASRSTIIC